jgi:protein phosphatase
MGGHERGDQAAQMAVDIAAEVLTARLEDHWNFAGDFGSAEPVDVLVGAFEQANRRIYEWAVEQDLTGGTGTTLTILACTHDQVLAANVGDSRAYRIGATGVEQLSVDHSWVGEQVRAGQLTAEEAARSPLRNQLTQAVGFEPAVTPHVTSVPLEPGCVFLACTDGLTEVVDTEALFEVASAGDGPEHLCTALAALAVAAGTTDNVTIAALSTGPIPAAPVPQAVPTHEQPVPAADPGEDEAEAPVDVEPSRETEERDVTAPILAARREDLARERTQRMGAIVIASVLAMLLGMLVGWATGGQPGGATPPAPEAPAAPPGPQPAAPGRAADQPTQAPPPEPSGAVSVRVRCEGTALVVAATEEVTLDVYPRGAYRDSEARLTSTAGAQPGETRFELQQAPPAAWADRQVALTIKRLGDGKLGLSLDPEASVYVDQQERAGDELAAIEPAGSRTRIGFYFPTGDDPQAIAIALEGFPVGAD